MNRSAPVSEEFPFLDLICKINEEIISQNKTATTLVALAIAGYCWMAIKICKMKPKKKSTAKRASIVVTDSDPALSPQDSWV